MNILLTGNPGCGKSSLVEDLIEALKGKRIAGIITPEIRDKGRKGFKIIDLASGKEDILASVEIKTMPRVGKYGVNIEGIDNIVDIFLESFETAECIFWDEIGKMELYSTKFKNVSEEILKSNKHVIAVVHRNFVNRYKGMGELIRVEREKIDRIKKYVLDKLK